MEERVLDRELLQELSDGGKERVSEQFRGQLNPRWVRFAVGYSDIEWDQGEIRFVIDGATADGLSDAEIGDYRLVARNRLPWRPPLSMEVRARASHPAEAFKGTAGFGFWNAPGTATDEVGAPPNAVWFFFNSPESTLQWVADAPGHGWRAEVINGGSVPAPAVSLGRAALRMPGLRRLLARAAQSQIQASVCALTDVDWTGWHTYRLHWTTEDVTFWVDDREVARFSHPPQVPLGFVAWVDNQRTVITPQGDMDFGLMMVNHRQWLALDSVRIERLPPV